MKSNKMATNIFPGLLLKLPTALSATIKPRINFISANARKKMAI